MALPMHSPSLFQPSKSSICLCHVPSAFWWRDIHRIKSPENEVGMGPRTSLALQPRHTEWPESVKWRWQLPREGRNMRGKSITQRVTVPLATALGADTALGSWVTDFFPGKGRGRSQDWAPGQARELLSLATGGYVVLASLLGLLTWISESLSWDNNIVYPV